MDFRRPPSDPVLSIRSRQVVPYRDQVLVQGALDHFGAAFAQVIDNVLEYWKILDILVQN